jgi:hypothetical protein
MVPGQRSAPPEHPCDGVHPGQGNACLLSPCVLPCLLAACMVPHRLMRWGALTRPARDSPALHLCRPLQACHHLQQDDIGCSWAWLQQMRPASAGLEPCAWCGVKIRGGGGGGLPLLPAAGSRDKGQRWQRRKVPACLPADVCWCSVLLCTAACVSGVSAPDIVGHVGCGTAALQQLLGASPACPSYSASS